MVAAALLPVAVVGSLCLGEIGIGPGEVVRSIFGTGSPLGEIALDSRAPRLCVALLGGACLAASGTVLQAAVRNPFAGPELAGVVGGASVGAFIVLLVFPDAPSLVLPFASFAGALLAMGAGARARRRGSPARLALIGLAVTAACAAVTELMLLHAQPAAATAITWLSGSTYATELERPAAARRARRRAAAARVARRPAARRADARRRPRPRARAARRASSAPGCSPSAPRSAPPRSPSAARSRSSACSRPHAARLLAGGNHRRALPMAIALGALLLGLADTVGRTVLAPTEIPSGLVVSLIGAPYLAILLWRSRTA